MLFLREKLCKSTITEAFCGVSSFSLTWKFLQKEDPTFGSLKGEHSIFFFSIIPSKFHAIILAHFKSPFSSSMNSLTSLNLWYTEANLTYATSSNSFNLLITSSPTSLLVISDLEMF